MESQEILIPAKVLLECADDFQMLSDANREGAEQAESIYTKKMIGKAAQTYKHCAASLRGKYQEIIESRSASPKDPQG